MLDQLGATYSYVLQQAGEVVYVSPDALHCGWNWGGNTAAAINLEGKGSRGVGCFCTEVKDKGGRVNGASAMFHEKVDDE
jgi:hypothetical protein